MQKTLTAFAVAGTMALATIAGPSTANAGCRGCGVGAGIIGGLAAGAIIGGAIANSDRGYPPPAPVVEGAPPGRYWQATACARGPGWWGPDQFVGRDGYPHTRNFFFCP
jgi:hypothetical protein